MNLIKKFNFFIFVLLIFKCSGEKTPEIILDIDECFHCKMVISKKNEACGYFVGADFITFDSPGCLLKEYEKIRKNKEAVPKRIFFVDYINSNFIPADSTFFLLTTSIQTVMNAGVLCFNHQESAKSFIKYSEESITDWEGYQIDRGIPDKIISITLTANGMKPEIVTLEKNEIVEWQFSSEGLNQHINFYLKGYNALGEIEFSPGETVTKRMLAKFPGAGFPFICSGDESAIGMVKVNGAHTSDEEVM